MKDCSLNEKIYWKYMQIRKKFISHFFHDKYWHYCQGKKQLLSIEDGSQLIQTLLENKSHPCMIARFGASEMQVVAEYQKVKLGLKKEISPAAVEQLCKWSGFFPCDEKLSRKFAEIILCSAENLDLIGVWNVSMEEYTILRYASETQITKLTTLEPWYLPENPWTKALYRKKVLVIHPFSQSIKSQYEKRKLLFPGTDILPEFELYTLTAVQTIAGEKDPRFNDWFEALNYMYEEAMKIDFDVAILGCGAYGFPLASMLKQSGKKAIHLGGATQLLFGIRGKRWDDKPLFEQYYNDNWVRPLEIEKPRNSEVVENGCYW